MPNFLRFGRRSTPSIEPMQPAPALTGKAKLIAVLGAAALPALAIIAQWEGKRNDPYQDIVGVWTVCYGETRVDMRSYSDAECEDMLAEAVGDFGGGVLERNPGLIEHPGALAAASSLSYNIGQAAYARSTAAARFGGGDIAGGCEALTWYNRGTFARPREGRRCYQTASGGWSCVVPGLVNRRADEYRLCMTSVETG